MKPELVIFDCDGVLVDTEFISNRIFANLLTKYGLPFTTEDSMNTFMGCTMEKCLEIVNDKFHHTLPSQILDEYFKELFKAFDSELEAIPGIHALLTNFSYKICVASSGTYEKMDQTLGKTHLKSFFKENIFSALDVKKSKPAPDLFLHAAKKMNTTPNSCLVIEDSPKGVEAARSAGMHVFGFSYRTEEKRLKEAGAHLTFDHMDQLQNLIDSL